MRHHHHQSNAHEPMTSLVCNVLLRNSILYQLAHMHVCMSVCNGYLQVAMDGHRCHNENVIVTTFIYCISTIEYRSGRWDEFMSR